MDAGVCAGLALAAIALVGLVRMDFALAVQLVATRYEGMTGLVWVLPPLLVIVCAPIIGTVADRYGVRVPVAVVSLLAAVAVASVDVLGDGAGILWLQIIVLAAAVAGLSIALLAAATSASLPWGRGIAYALILVAVLASRALYTSGPQGDTGGSTGTDVETWVLAAILAAAGIIFLVWLPDRDARRAGPPPALAPPLAPAERCALLLVFLLALVQASAPQALLGLGLPPGAYPYLRPDEPALRTVIYAGIGLLFGGFVADRWGAGAIVTLSILRALALGLVAAEAWWPEDNAMPAVVLDHVAAVLGSIAIGPAIVVMLAGRARRAGLGMLCGQLVACELLGHVAGGLIGIPLEGSDPIRHHVGTALACAAVMLAVAALARRHTD